MLLPPFYKNGNGRTLAFMLVHKKMICDDTCSDPVILATAGYDHTIRFWQAHSGICHRTVQHPDSVSFYYINHELHCVHQQPELLMVTVYINNTKHITIANNYIPPRDSTSTHNKTANTAYKTTNTPHSVMTGDVNAHSTLWHTYTTYQRGRCITTAVSFQTT